MATTNQVTFPGFQFPNTTQIPNEVFDTLMPHLSGGELKVLLYICRRTFGFRKDSDSISLTQIARGITTKAGRALDQGTGLSKRQVQRALRALEEHQVIQVKRKVDETGLHEINTYRLNVRSGEKMSPPLETPVSGEVGTPMSPGVETPASTTKKREQNKEEQKKDTDDVVAAKTLENFGITQSAATILTRRYPAQYIKEKVTMAQGLVAAGSRLVSQNPAGWLRRAIEEDYTVPKTAERRRQRSAREKQQATLAQAKSRAQHTPEEESQPTQTATTTLYQCPQTVVTELRDNNRENKETERTDSEKQTVWNNALEQVKKDLPPGETADRLAGTTLIEVTETKAVIGVPNRFAVPWFERRLYGQIAKAMKVVVGKDVDLQFISSDVGFSRLARSECNPPV
jgi:phage replication O-like protein O